MSNSKRTINECALVALEISIPTPGRKATKRDLQKAAPNLPPDQIATMGVFRAFEPKLTNKVMAKKREAERLLESVGVKFGRMGRLIPPDEIEHIEKELDRIGIEFRHEKSEMLANHQATKDAWPKKFPDWAEVLEQKSVSPIYLEQHTQFRYHLMQVVPAGGGGNTHETIAGLSGQLIREVVSSCKEVLEESFIGREQVGQKALNPVRAIRKKVAGLAFVSAEASVARDYLDSVLSTMPDRGKLTTAQTQQMRSALHTFADPEKLNREIEWRMTHKGVQEPDEDESDGSNTVINDLPEAESESEATSNDSSEPEETAPVIAPPQQAPKGAHVPLI
ncbi:DUF3150 domain-containing protein [Thioalkalivibrio sp. ALE16]|uniref:DUF3150 domain-containing protein n=1 Tax=Thioalkalivibrio sp. ALE16 TaxID=1158172 RepID=UPI0003735D4B|nr:DUF3150 domain-containing protein [Thioalkalivibrio sp. ALE16]